MFRIIKVGMIYVQKLQRFQHCQKNMLKTNVRYGSSLFHRILNGSIFNRPKIATEQLKTQFPVDVYSGKMKQPHIAA